MIPRIEQRDLAELFQHRSLRKRLPLRTDNPVSANVPGPPRLETNRGWRIRNILAPTDFSPRSIEAVAQAAELARRYDATLTILHVIDINSPSARTHVGPAEELMRRLWATGTSESRRLSESLIQQHTKTQTRIVEGLPAEVIIENSSGFDLLVMNEERSGSAWNFFSRHTARRVIERAACPLLVVHPRTVPVNA
jgi:nucleotide-binding universal stress UspA family protein